MQANNKRNNGDSQVGMTDIDHNIDTHKNDQPFSPEDYPKPFACCFAFSFIFLSFQFGKQFGYIKQVNAVADKRRTN